MQPLTSFQRYKARVKKELEIKNHNKAYYERVDTQRRHRQDKFLDLYADTKARLESRGVKLADNPRFDEKIKTRKGKQST